MPSQLNPNGKPLKNSEGHSPCQQKENPHCHAIFPPKTIGSAGLVDFQSKSWKTQPWGILSYSLSGPLSSYVSPCLTSHRKASLCLAIVGCTPGGTGSQINQKSGEDGVGNVTLTRHLKANCACLQESYWGQNYEKATLKAEFPFTAICYEVYEHNCRFYLIQKCEDLAYFDFVAYTCIIQCWHCQHRHSELLPQHAACSAGQAT